MPMIADVWPRFTDAAGKPYVNATIYFGEPNVDTKLNPINVYGDRAKSENLGSSVQTNSYGQTPKPIHVFQAFSYVIEDADSNTVDSVAYAVGVADLATIEVDSITDLLALSAADGQIVYSSGYHAGSRKGGGHFEWDASSTETADNGLIFGSGTGRWYRIMDGLPNFHWWGAKGNGTDDDTVALQAALDANRDIYPLPGRYRTTANLVHDPARNRNVGIVGTVVPSIYPATAQTGGPAWDGDKECVIWYDGSAGTGTAVLASSPEAVNTEPASTFDTTEYSLRLEGITLDGNDKAQYGLYAARVQDIEIQNCVFRGCKGDGLYVNGTFSGRMTSIAARNNGGRGISIGAAREDFGWSTNNLCNALTIVDVWCYANGRDGTFNETTAPHKGCGMYFAPHRNCSILGLNCEVNDGVGLVFNPTSSGNIVRNFYAELNSNFDHTGSGSALASGRTSKRYAIRFVGESGGVSYGNAVDTGFVAAEYLWITGAEPSTGRPESAPEFANLVGGSGIVADYGNYRLVNMGSGFISSITGSAPTGASHHPQGFILDADASSAAFKHYNAANFTPTLEGASVAGTGWAYTINQGRSWRVGDIEYIQIEFSVSTVGSGASGGVLIKGLPNTIKNGNGYDASFVVGAYSGLAGAVNGIVGFGAANGTSIALNKLVSGTGSTALAVSDLASSTTFHLSGWYPVA